MYVFGGRGVGTILNDVQYYNREDGTWAEVTATGSVPSIRYGHAAGWDDELHRMYVFGGTGSGGAGVLQDLHLMLKYVFVFLVGIFRPFAGPLPSPLPSGVP